ncbi:CRTAC1 family protein [Halomicrobium urmianum]|uniref:CRTAC1 family protein n=1 Tax=Halomicrobium urmianum TaxID=1586233 RepID=UPI001CD9BF75|nr:CRTAC1 family protein [Halomicrobium urmianum]
MRRRGLLVVAVALLAVTAGCSAPMGGASDADAGGEIGFEDATASAGLNYTDAVGTGIGNGNAGVYVADVDGDGWEDVLAVGGERPVLFENRGGEFTRSDALPDLNRSFKSAAFVDYDGDGSEDLLLLPAGGEVVALHNDGGAFERDDVGLGNVTYPLGAAPADYDGDGDQDLLLYQSGDWADEKPEGYSALNGTLDEDNGHPNILYENTGDGFERVGDAGIEGDRWSLSASFVDLTGDGRPDVHVANDYNSDVIYVNQGDGTFEQRLLRGNTARNGMSSEVVDVNRDGRPDVLVTNIHLPISRETMSPERYERVEDFLRWVIHSNRTRGNTLLINEGGGEFSDGAERWNLRSGGWGWAATATDFDNDGDRDLMHTTQNVVAIDREDPHYTYPMLWEREGGNFTTLDASERGLAQDNGRGMVTLDYDRDGDQDVISANYDGNYTLYENTVNTSETSSLQVRVVDDDGATAYGAEVRVEADDTQVRTQRPRTDYLSQESRVIHFGLGDADAADVTVTWPDGTERTVEGVSADQRVLLAPDGVEQVGEFTEGADIANGDQG